MLSCRDLSHQADAFLDCELGLWQRLRIRLHLSMCNGCSRFMGQMRTTRRLITAEAQVADPDDAEIDNILAVFHEENQSSGQDGPVTFVKD